MFQTWSVLCAMLFSCPSRSRDRIWLPCLNLLMMVAPFLLTLRSTYLETFVSLYTRGRSGDELLFLNGAK